MYENKPNEEDLNLQDAVSTIWRGKYFIIIFSIVFLTLGSIFVRTLDSKYTVSILLAPVQEEQTAPNFGGLGGLASLAGISLPRSNASDFSKFELMLKTEEISALIFRDEKLVQNLFIGEWNNKEQTFQQPQETQRQQIVKSLKKLLIGQLPKEYLAPNPARLARFISSEVQISLDKKTEYLRLSTESSNPELLTKLLLSMIKNTDELFKKKFLKESNDAVKFYQIKISKAKSQEQREILATLIAKEERKLLLATRDGPFVAEILTGPNTSLAPTSPKANLILLLSLLLGGFFSISLILVRNLVKKS